MTEKDKQKSQRRSFYSRVLDEAEKLGLEEARDVEGLDEEIAMLRVKLRELIENEPERYDLHIKVTNTLARLVGIRYSISKEQKKSLKEAITRVLTDIAVPLGVKVLIK